MAKEAKVSLLLKARDLTGRAFKGARSNLQSLKSAIFSLKTAAAAVGAAVVTGLGASLVKSFATQQTAVNKLNQALLNTGNFSEEASLRLQESASAIQKITTAGDEALISATAMGAQLTGLDPENLERMQTAIVGLADTFFEGNLDQAALQIGKSIGGTINTLSRYSITLDTSATNQEKLNQLLEQTNGFFEISKAAARDLAGQLTQAKNAFGDLRETLGQVIVTAFNLNDTGTTLRERIEAIDQAILENQGEWIKWTRVTAISLKSTGRLLFNLGEIVVRVTLGLAQGLAGMVLRIGAWIGDATNLVIRGVNHMTGMAVEGIDLVIVGLNKIPGVDITPIGNSLDIATIATENLHEAANRALDDMGENAVEVGKSVEAIVDAVNDVADAASETADRKLIGFDVQPGGRPLNLGGDDDEVAGTNAVTDATTKLEQALRAAARGGELLGDAFNQQEAEAKALEQAMGSLIEAGVGLDQDLQGTDLTLRQIIVRWKELRRELIGVELDQALADATRRSNLLSVSFNQQAAEARKLEQVMTTLIDRNAGLDDKAEGMDLTLRQVIERWRELRGEIVSTQIDRSLEGTTDQADLLGEAFHRQVAEVQDLERAMATLIQENAGLDERVEGMDLTLREVIDRWRELSRQMNRSLEETAEGTDLLGEAFQRQATEARMLEQSMGALIGENADLDERVEGMDLTLRQVIDRWQELNQAMRQTAIEEASRRAGGLGEAFHQQAAEAQALETAITTLIQRNVGLDERVEGMDLTLRQAIDRWRELNHAMGRSLEETSQGTQSLGAAFVRQEAEAKALEQAMNDLIQENVGLDESIAGTDLTLREIIIRWRELNQEMAQAEIRQARFAELQAITNSLLEQAKTPLQIYQETMTQLVFALQLGLITMTQFAAAARQLKRNLDEANQGSIDLNAVFQEMLANTLQSFARQMESAFRSFADGSKSAGEAFSDAMIQAIAGTARALGELFLVEAAGALARGFLGNPAAFAAAAKFTAAATAAFALAGILSARSGAGGGGGGGAGAGVASSSQRDIEGQDKGIIQLTIRGGTLLDLSDPFVEQQLKEVFEDVSGRRVTTVFVGD